MCVNELFFSEHTAMTRQPRLLCYTWERDQCSDSGSRPIFVSTLSPKLHPELGPHAPSSRGFRSQASPDSGRVRGSGYLFKSDPHDYGAILVPGCLTLRQSHLGLHLPTTTNKSSRQAFYIRAQPNESPKQKTIFNLQNPSRKYNFTEQIP